MFLTEDERKITDDFISQGYLIKPVADFVALTWMREKFVTLAANIIGIKRDFKDEDFLNYIHLNLKVSELNAFRLEIIREINSLDGFREMYFHVCRPYLECLVGNELAMQLKINLSIQLPKDDSSLLPVHADTWSGDSPFEVVVWLPFVDCFGTKAMYILPPLSDRKLTQDFTSRAGHDSESLFQEIKNEVKWIEVSYGNVLIFNQALPHGNRINEENETRWSMNCRFKGIFTPYGDKKIGEFFEPITLRACSKIGMSYQLPKIK